MRFRSLNIWLSIIWSISPKAMEFTELLSERAQAFILENQFLEPARVMLEQKAPAGLSLRDLVQQIKGKQVARNKIPSWYNVPKVLYGETKSLEQCSSELTARYKGSLISGVSLVDLTGGLGVDTHFLGQQFRRVEYNDPDPILCSLAQHNFQAVGADHIQVVNKNARSYLEDFNTTVDWIYLDPDRRQGGGRKYRVEDCRPNVIELMPLIFSRTSCVMIKLSPMLDLTSFLSRFQQTKSVHVISVKNECKELVFILERNYQGPVEMTAANFTSHDQWQKISYLEFQERDAQSTFSEPQRYLYEPNSSLMKLAPFKWIGQKYNIQKLHPNSHLYTSQELLFEFPGRIFEIKWVSSYRPRQIKKLVSGKANVVVRNFPSDVKTIRKECGLTDGGKDYLFATTGPGGQLLVINGQKVTEKSER